MVLCDVNELREFMATTFLFSNNFTLGDADSFLHTGILDSTGVLQIILFLEERYQITLTDDEIVPDNLDSIQRLKVFVDRKLNGTCDQRPRLVTPMSVSAADSHGGGRRNGVSST